ncbi:MAG: transglutaminase family protein [Prolixibacteraceae bacterium]|jgi:hypothetical protein
MTVYQITYETQNTYSSQALEATLEFLILPATNNDQELLESKFDFTPVANPYRSKNIFGFDVLRFRIKNLEGGFKFSLQATVKKDPVNPFGFKPIGLEEEKKIRESNAFIIDHFPFLNFGPQTNLPVDFEFPVLGEQESVFDFVTRVSNFIHIDFTFDNSITDPLRKLDATIQEGKGVCQDFTHLMLAILRRNNIPCRYVSGYLNQGENIVGTGAIHAWVQVMIPGIGWIGFDPTNNLLEDHHFIKIAHGVDINDCPTLKGVIKGYGTNQTDYHVLVEEQIKDINQ